MPIYEGFLAQPGAEPYPARIAMDTEGVITGIERIDGLDDSAPFITPGLADLHNHGGAGFSFPTSDLEGCRAAARHHRSFGSTTLLASTVSQKREVLLPQLDILATLAENDELDGIHAEGPFVNACRCGAQDPDAIVPGDPDFFADMLEAARGQLRSITIAPETAHAHEIVDACAADNVIVSLGHTDADFSVTTELIRYALQRGATVTATHLFNAMPPFHHRDPGPIAAFLDAAATDNVYLELIADSVHLHNHTVATVAHSVGFPAVSFVSDAMGAAGKADGDYVLGALAVTVKDGVARLTTSDGSEGAIAGGTSRVSDQVRIQANAGLPLPQILLGATSGHALVGCEHRATVSEGPAGFIVWNRDLSVREVYREGRSLVDA